MKKKTVAETKHCIWGNSDTFFFVLTRLPLHKSVNNNNKRPHEYVCKHFYKVQFEIEKKKNYKKTLETRQTWILEVLEENLPWNQLLFAIACHCMYGVVLEQRIKWSEVVQQAFLLSFTRVLMPYMIITTCNFMMT